MTQPMPCAHPESMRTHQTAAGRTVITCHRAGCGAVISDQPAACRTPYIIGGNPDRVALCALGRGHAEPDHTETP